MPVKIFNQGKRTIRGHAIDPRDGNAKPYVFAPKTALEFDDETARKLKKIYGNEVLSVDDVKSQFDSAMQAADTPSAPATGAPPPAVESLAGLSQQERDLIAALREKNKTDAAPPAAETVSESAAAPQQPPADAADFVNVSEEEAMAAKRAIEEVRARNAAAGKPSVGDRLLSLVGLAAKPGQEDGA